MNRIISFIVLICLIIGSLFVGLPSVLATENSASVGSIPQATNYTAIAAGYYHTVALKDNGTVAAWGYNGYNDQCKAPAGLSGVKAIAAGNYHTVALKEDGTVVAWGGNGYGQCNVPTGLSGVKAVAAGYYHTVAVKEDSTVVAWGNNGYGQCKAPAGLSGVKAVAAGDDHTIALKEDGTVVAWGYNGNGQCNVPAGLSGVKAIAAGFKHTVALKEDGTVVVWGDNESGQCTVPAGLSGVKAIAAGNYYTVALKEDGTVVAWGNNGYGQCNAPTGLSGVKAITATFYSTVVLKDDNTVISFGDKSYIIPSTKASSANAVTPYNEEFNTSSPESITVKMYAEGSNKLTNIKNGTDSLTSSDYSISGSAITINKDYLSSCFASSDKLSLTLDFDNGVDPVLSIEKSDGTKTSTCKSISTGYNHTVAVKEDGTVIAWGYNGDGQCNVPVELTGVKTVAAGYYHTIALKEDGTVVAWGENSYGQRNVPVGLTGIKDIACGEYHTVALKEDGTIVLWGDNTYAQCTAPADLCGVKDIASGANFTAALKTDGTVVVWGNNDKGQCNVPANLSSVKSINAGQKHMIALKEDGTVVAWGYNGDGQCNVPAGLSGVKAISAGYNHTVALKEDGTVVTWGGNEHGQCTVPTGISGVKAIAAGGYNTVALKEDGTIISFGDKNYIIPGTKALSANSLNQYSTEFDLLNSDDISIKIYASDKNKLMAVKNDTNSLTSEDYSISGSAVTINKSYLSSCFTKTSKLLLTFDFDSGNDPVLTIEKADVSAQNFKAVAVGQYHTVGLKGDGTVTAWGNNDNGQCNIPSGLSSVRAIAASDYHTVALKKDGTVVAWGNNDNGQCNIPAGLSRVKAIATRLYHTVALKEDGTVVAWGNNDNGQCNIPAGLSRVKAIATGLYHTVALKEDGTVVAWGYNNNGQCTIPSGLSGVKAIAAGDYHTVALKEDGTVVAWGYNNNGQCNIPSGLLNVKAISADSNHTMAIKEDGIVVAWGDNDCEQCKNFNGLTNVKAISTGKYHSIALKENGSLFTCGYNQYGECAVPLGARVKAISAGNHISVALKEDGTFNAWGDNYYKECNIPDAISGVKAVAVGGNHAVTLKEDGTVATLGDNGSGQCNVPSGLSGVKAIACGYNHTVALKEDGTIVAWGDNGNGQCNVPSGLSAIKAIACGYNHTVALKEDGTVVAWGDNGYDQCSVPNGLSGVKAISAGNRHTVALKEDGTIVAWGSNGYNSQCNVPKGLSGVKAISAGDNYTVALKENGTIVSWGSYTAPAGVSGVKAISGTTVLKEDGTVIDLRNNCIIPFPKAASTNLINPSSAGFDSLNPLDVRIDIDAGAGKLVTIKDGNNELTSSDYTVSGSAVIISKNYLASVLTKNAPLGQKVSLTFDFDNGNDPVLTVQKVSISIDKTPPSITVIEPVDGSIIGSRAKITVKAFDKYGINSIKLQYSIDGIKWTEIDNKSTEDSAMFSWNAAALTSSSVKVRAIAIDTSGNESTDSPIRTYTIDSTGPSKIKGLTASTPSAVSVILKWDDIPDNDLDYFQIEGEYNGGFKIIQFTNTLGTEFTSLLPGTTYILHVVGFDKYGNKGTYSDEITVTTSSDSQPPVITSITPKPGRYSNSISLHANVTDDAGVTYFKFQKSTDKVNWTDIVALTSSGTSHYSYFSYDFDISKEPEGILAVRGIAYDSSGNKSNSENSYIEYYVDHAPQTPTKPAIKASTSQLTLSWEKSADADFAYYKVYRAEGPYARYTCIESNLTSLYYVDSNVKKDVVYYYQISAVDQAGNESLLSKSSTSQLVDDKVITVDPMEITVGKSNDVMITVNRDGQPIAGGTIDIGDYIKEQVLDSNGQAKVAVMPSASGNIVVTAYDKNHVLLTSKTIKAVAATTDSAISPDVTTCSITTPEAIKVNMTLNGNTLVNILAGSAPLTKYDYSVNGNVVTINKNYLSYYFGKYGKSGCNCILTFKFSNGKDATLVIKPQATGDDDHKLGDVNRDKNIDVFDATILKAVILKKRDESTIDRVAADMNKDGSITGLDYLLLKQMLQNR